MNWIVAKIRWIMVASGLLTCAALYAAFMPREGLEFLFDRSPESSLAQLIVRHWAVLITLVGAMLIYGAFDQVRRTPILILAGLEKLGFLGVMLAFGRQYLAAGVGIALAIDLVMVALFAAFLIGMRRIGARQVRPSQPTMPTGPRPEAGTRPPPRPPLVKAP